MILRSETRERRVRVIVAALWTCLVSGCAGATATAPASARDLPAYDGLLTSPDLQAVVDLQVQRNGQALTRLLSSPEASIRSRAALALASVQDQSALDALVDRLSDPDPRVRRHAAFALGQLALQEGGGFLVQALRSESDGDVRRAMLEAIGKRGGIADLEQILTLEAREGDEPTLTLALSRAALREVRPPGLVDALVGRLAHENPEVRERASYYFGRTPNVSAWTDRAGEVRARLDGTALDDPAAMHLVSALGRLAEVEEDAGRLARWMREAGDWRTRVNAAAAVRSPLWLENEVVRAAAVAALDDPSGHVRTTAAESLALLAWSDEELFALGLDLLEGPAEHWRVQLAFLSPLASQGELLAVLEWIRRMAEEVPVAAARGLDVVGGFRPASVTELLFELSDHPDPLLRSTAVQELAGRLPIDGPRDGLRPYYELFSRVVMEPVELPAARAAAALAHPSLEAFGSDELVEEAFREWQEADDANVLVPLMDAMGPSSIDLLREVVESDDLRLRQAAARAVQRMTGTQVATAREGPAEPEIDWGYLSELGPMPRVRVETERGVMVLRLLTRQAPLSTQAFAQNVSTGRYDGTLFHRVVPNFVIQGGDFALGDGTGDAGYRLHSEFTELSFERAVLGMASSGKDTEGSQFYLTHSLQPHLNGGYTAFGWLESGGDVLDRIQQGDRVISMELLGG